MDVSAHQPDQTRIPLYTVADAQRIVRVHPVSARRWLKGYSYVRDGKRRFSPKKLGPDAQVLDGVLLMSFQDLLELRVAAALRSHHISWKNVAATAKLFREEWNSPHPFALQRLRTDGQAVFADIGQKLKDPRVLQLGKDQYVFDAVVSPSLFDVVDFEDGVPVRLWPAGREIQIVVDPARSFGQPVLEDAGVPVATLVSAYAANDNNVGRVARWYDVSVEAVEAALRFNAGSKLAA